MGMVTPCSSKKRPQQLRAASTTHLLPCRIVVDPGRKSALLPTFLSIYCPFFPIYCRKIENRAKIFTNSLFEYLFGQFSTKRGARKGGLERTGKRRLWSPVRPEEARGGLGVIPSLPLPPFHILCLFLDLILLCYPFYHMEPKEGVTMGR